MIPILFDKNATTFNTNGLGRLSDALSCHVVEERNGKYELSMEYPVDGVHFSDIEISAIICAVPADGKGMQPFRIYKVEKLISGKARIFAEHISYQARYIPVMPFIANSCVSAMAGLANNAATTNPFTLWTDISKNAIYIQEVPESIRARLGGQEGSLLDLYGGEFEWDNYTIKLHSQRGHDSGVTLRYGKNITDLTQEKNITNTYTAVCPYYKSSDDTECLTLPEKYITSDNAGNFPYIMAKSVDMTSEFGEGETATVETLRAKTQEYITKNNIGVPVVSIKVSFVALWQTEEYKSISALERVNLCDTVTVVFEKLGVSATAKVVRTNYNVLIDRYDSIELGETKTQLSGKIANQESDLEVTITSHMQKAIAHATALITGGLGGYVLLKLNADGQPEEILIMDKPSVEESVQMIRMNKNGIGFSHNGYNGPFHTAWTIDSHFVADFIDTGNLNADLLQVGRIQPLLEGGAKSDNYWDMVTGDFHLSQSVQVGNSTIASVYDVNTGIDDYDITLNQAEVLRKLTNNGAAQGIYLKNGQLYINANYIWTGIISDRAGTNFWNMTTGAFKLSSNAQVGSSTVASKKDVTDGDGNTLSSAKAYANSEAKAQADAYVKSYDTLLNQKKVFDKLTNNGAAQGISLTNNQLYVNATYISTGILTDKAGHFWLNMDTGVMHMQGANFDSWVKGCTFTGNKFQNAETGQRVVLDESSSLKGYHNNTLHNLINMEQVVSGTHQMTIDADTQLNIRTPIITVLNQSKGEASADAYVTATNLGGDAYMRVANIEKVMPNYPYSGNPYGVEELRLRSTGDNNDLLVTLPVYLYVTWAKEERVHGMVITGATAPTDVV